MPMKVIVPVEELPRFRNFDYLPRPVLIDKRYVGGLYGVSGPTVDRRVKSGEIPPPEPGTEGAPRWQVGKIRDALAAPRTGKRKKNPGGRPRKPDHELKHPRRERKVLAAEVSG